MIENNKYIFSILGCAIFCCIYFSCKDEVKNVVDPVKNVEILEETLKEEESKMDHKPVKELTFNDERAERKKKVIKEKTKKNKVAIESPKVQDDRKKMIKTKPVKVLKKGKFSFEQEEFDFGFIEVGEVVDHAFSFTNVGNAPINISNAIASCGCTTPVFPFLPIEPGQKGEILVRFNSKDRLGGQVATVTVFSDAEVKEKELQLKGVIRAEIANPAEFVDTMKND